MLSFEASFPFGKAQDLEPSVSMAQAVKVREEEATLSRFGFFLVQEWPFRDAHLLFKKTLLKPLFL